MSDKAAATLLTLEIDRADDVLYTEVRQLFPDNKRIVLDLTGLTHMDSMGLGALVRLYVSARSASCDLELINLGKQVRQLLGTTNLLLVFTVIGEQGIRMG
jgi:anti-sigma B factor antagonist